MIMFEQTYTCIFERNGEVIAGRLYSERGREAAEQTACSYFGLLNGRDRVIAVIPGDFADRTYVFQKKESELS
jgi:hypothetical protein